MEGREAGQITAVFTCSKVETAKPYTLCGVECAHQVDCEAVAQAAGKAAHRKELAAAHQHCAQPLCQREVANLLNIITLRSEPSSPSDYDIF